MINGLQISLGNIIWKVMRNPLALDLTYEQAAEFALEFIKLVGTPLIYIDELKKLEIKNYKTAIPSNVINVRGIRYLGTNGCQDPIAMRYATDLYHNNQDEDNITEYTYTLQNCVITTSQKEGFIEISYKALSVDEHGYPLIPDNESFKVGLEYYIIHRTLEGLWSMGKITDKVFQYYEQKRHYYSAQATNSMTIKNMDQMETMFNAINRLIIDVNPHETFYKNFGVKEVIKQK